jgi:hypothetical protein
MIVNPRMQDKEKKRDIESIDYKLLDMVYRKFKCGN